MKASYESKSVIENNQDKLIHLDYYGNWIYEDADTYLDYIKLTEEKPIPKPKIEYKPTLADKLMPYLFGTILIILLVALLIGLGTMFSWIF